MAMSEVNATGTLSYPEVCSEDSYILMHTFIGYVYIPTWANTLFVIFQGFPRASINRRVEM